MSNALSRLSEYASVLVKWFSGVGLMLMTLIIAWQVFARYVLNASPAWGEQAALLLMIWYVMFAAAAGVREGFHIRITVFADSLPEKPKRVINLVAHAVVGLFGLGMAWWGAELVRETWQHVIPTLGLSRGVAYIPISAAGVLIFGFALEHVVADLRAVEVSKLWN
ncbi:MAG: TRAP transporter small permease [Gammaproteobacteria bacterium]|nr:TRAP transporter small permease [Gammaproteobacteria bacterium]